MSVDNSLRYCPDGGECPVELLRGKIKTLQKELAALAIESVKRDIGLAKLEAEVMVWAKAEQEGRLVVLPCKVGDAVYKLWYEPCHNGEDRPDGMGCAGCIDECDIKRAVVPFTANSVEHIVGMRNSLNRFWFLTREEAEAALKGAEHDNTQAET